MPGGRPTDYNQEILDKTKDYIINYADQDSVVPSIAGLAYYLHLSRRTIYDWAGHDDKVEFSHMLEHLLSIQEKLLINKGLTSVFNSNIVKLMLAKHGYVEKTEHTLRTKISDVLNSLENGQSSEGQKVASESPIQDTE